MAVYLKVLLPFIFMFQSCIGTKLDSQREYLDFNFQLQNELDGKLKDSTFSFLFKGNLSPNDESELFSKDDRLYIVFNAKKINQSWNWEFSPERNPNSPYSVSFNIKKSKFKERPTYLIDRTTDIQSSRFTNYEFIHFIKHLGDEPNFKLKLAESKIHQFLCSSFNCESYEIRNTDLSINSLKYTLNDETKRLYPEFYEKAKSRLSQLSIKVDIIQYPSKTKVIHMETGKDFIRIDFFKNAIDISKNFFQFQIKTNVDVRALGLHFELKNLDYYLDLDKKGDTYTASGKYKTIPDYKLEGRLLYIIPPSFVEVFLPQDLEEYFQDYFHLLVFGGESGGGNYFRANAQVKENKMNIHTVYHSEIFQKRFSFFSDGSRAERGGDIISGSFLKDLRSSILLEWKKD